MSRLVLIDRDGTINVERHYLSSPEELLLLPGATSGIRRLNQLGLSVVIVTNQSAIGRGMFGPDRLKTIHDRLCDMLAEGGAKLAGIYVCPHRPDEGCGCRKPLPGMARQAAADFGANLAAAFVIGDKPCDIELGRSIGAATILVRTGYGGRADGLVAKPDFVADDLDAAAQLIEIALGARPS
ncbi:MAG TPA: HAD family hydrolase [Gemmataceae bacterium]|nr:HAD family hydrolase [Gemmataceae bacterium]